MAAGMCAVSRRCCRSRHSHVHPHPPPTDAQEGGEGGAAAQLADNAFNVALTERSVVAPLARDAPVALMDAIGMSAAGVERVAAAPSLPRHQVVNHFPNAAAVTHKAHLVRALNAVLAAEEGDDGRHVFDVIPTTFYFGSSAATDTASPVLQSFLRRFAAGNGARVAGDRMPAKHCAGNLWVIKAAPAGNAASVVVCNNAVDIKTTMSALRGDFVVQKCAFGGDGGVGEGGRGTHHTNTTQHQCPLPSHPLAQTLNARCWCMTARCASACWCWCWIAATCLCMRCRCCCCRLHPLPTSPPPHCRACRWRCCTACMSPRRRRCNTHRHRCNCHAQRVSCRHT